MDLKSSRSEDLVKIQSLLPSIQLGELDKPIWIPSKSGHFTTFETWKAIRFKLLEVTCWKII